MKEGWSYKKLGEVCEILNGFAFQSKNYVPEGIRVIRITNVQKGYIEDTDPKYYPYETQDELSRYLLNDGDMLLSLTGNVGRVAIIDKHYLPAYLNQRVACIRVKNGNCLDLNYLFHLLYSKKFEEDCINSARGAAQKNMSTVWLASYPILVPPLSKQHSIVTRLDTAFSHIDALKADAEKQLNEARKLFQAELTECMTPKEGWEEKRIKEVGEVIGGTTPSTSNPQFWGGDVCWISPAELHGEHYLYDSVKKITTEAVEAKSLKELPIGTVILSSRAPIGKIAINKVPMYCNQGFKCVVCKSELYNEYLYWWFYGKTEYLNSLGTGATFLEISKKVVENIIIPIPPLDIQHSIVFHLDSLSSHIRKLEELQQKTIAECDALKQAMLREVFE